MKCQSRCGQYWQALHDCNSSPCAVCHEISWLLPCLAADAILPALVRDGHTDLQSHITCCPVSISWCPRAPW